MRACVRACPYGRVRVLMGAIAPVPEYVGVRVHLWVRERAPARACVGSRIHGLQASVDCVRAHTCSSDGLRVCGCV